MTVKATIHSTGKGTCLLSERPDADGLTVSFDDGTVQEAFLSWRAFRQLLALKTGQTAKRPAAAPPAAATPRPAA